MRNVFIDKEKFLALKENSIGCFVAGSHLYKTNTEKSDIDYVMICEPYRNQLFNPFLRKHQFQYRDKENYTDYNIVDVSTFIRNIVEGESVVYFEVLMSGQFKNSDSTFLCYLDSIKEQFITYNIIRAYLNFAKRDILSFDRRNNKKTRIDGVIHIERCIAFAEQLINGKTLTLEREKVFERRETMAKIELTTEYLRYVLKVNIDLIEQLRKDLNNKLNEMQITRYLNPTYQQAIVTKLIQCKFHEIENSIDLTDLYESNENP